MTLDDLFQILAELIIERDRFRTDFVRLRIFWP